MQIWMQLMQWIHHMTPWVAVGMAALESLFPPIPLTAVVAANVAAFGAVFAEGRHRDRELQRVVNLHIEERLVKRAGRIRCRF